jgi:predicted Zn-dependent protease
MYRKFLGAVGFVALLSACDVPAPEAEAPAPAQKAAVSKATQTARQSAQQFVSVVRTVEPIAERECRARTRGKNCDFKIVVDDRPGQPPNAFQTVDGQGRPILAFTLALIAGARNADELAFVMGHEAAHHIEGHLDRQRENAVAGAVLAGATAVLLGGDAATIQRAQKTGAQVGARTYSKDFELEADAMGTIIAARAGYNPLLGAQYFTRIPDPGNKFLGTHPPNAQRIEVVRRTVAGL